MQWGLIVSSSHDIIWCRKVHLPGWLSPSSSTCPMLKPFPVCLCVCVRAGMPACVCTYVQIYICLRACVCVCVDGGDCVHGYIWVWSLYGCIPVAVPCGWAEWEVVCRFLSQKPGWLQKPIIISSLKLVKWYSSVLTYKAFQLQLLHTSIIYEEDTSPAVFTGSLATHTVQFAINYVCSTYVPEYSLHCRQCLTHELLYIAEWQEILLRFDPFPTCVLSN